MNWNVKEFQALSNDELYSIMKARVDVFVVEQECAYEEIDNYDQAAIHYFLTIDNQIAAYVRILPSNTKYEEVSIGRVLVTRDFRANGYAKLLMKKAIQFVTDEWTENTIKIQAQNYLHKFYSALGFVQISDVYLDDNIPHIDMIWSKNQ
ncbi:GNAT family N-acetyltransferase [Virgibacillus necropolis]|uniref:GNAT family N-acetyltransferase n=1 Tax=Virgibacillus necropolis TaxID=163877 RepID=A0A221MHM9_9BACI|nr:GNAT family N-acetyltransferase [Virgibacillus necropolis]ASN07146.1 GNAT family N-acetyltransferase [Virgibacillus necropolis]